MHASHELDELPEEPSTMQVNKRAGLCYFLRPLSPPLLLVPSLLDLVPKTQKGGSSFLTLAARPKALPMQKPFPTLYPLQRARKHPRRACLSKP